MPDPVHDGATESNDFVTELSASSKTDLLLGTLDMENGKDYNAAVLISGATQEMQVYWKVHLVPFGEYVPLRHSFPLFAAVVREWVPGDFASGKRHTLFRLTNGDVQIAPLPHPNDGQALIAYTESYQYDADGRLSVRDRRT